MKVLVLGGTGMLGHALHRVLDNAGVEVVASVRRDAAAADKLPSRLRRVATGSLSDGPELARVLDEVRPQVVVNAVGLIKQHSGAQNLLDLFSINARTPRLLEHLTRRSGTTLVQFSTDCVFSGARGAYTEDDPPDATDAYGMSKFVGEVTSPHCLTFRTSIIGRGLTPNGSLVDWFLGSAGTVKGYGRAIFSGFPVNEIGVMLVRMLPAIADGRLRGLFHLSAAPIDKLALLRLVAARWHKTDVHLVPDDGFRIDRSLDSSRLRRVAGIVPAPWPELINRMYDFYQGED